jgi:hypothetical protein
MMMAGEQIAPVEVVDAQAGRALGVTPSTSIRPTARFLGLVPLNSGGADDN